MLFFNSTLKLNDAAENAAGVVLSSNISQVKTKKTTKKTKIV